MQNLSNFAEEFRNTRAEFRRTSPVPNHSTDVLRTPGYGRPQPLLLDWIDDITITIELLCD
jgi:hypothetical protein